MKVIAVKRFLAHCFRQYASTWKERRARAVGPK